MLLEECQVSVHERDEQTYVFYKVSRKPPQKKIKIYSLCDAPPLKKPNLFSFRQVQDLEKQLAQARAQIQQLKSMGKDFGPGEVHNENSLHIPDFGANPEKRPAP